MELLPSPNDAVALLPEKTIDTSTVQAGSKPLFPTPGYDAPVRPSEVQAKEDEPNFFQGVMAGLSTTLGSAIYKAIQAPVQNIDPSFDVKKKYTDHMTRFGQEDEDTEKYLLKAVNDDDFLNRQRLTAERKANEAVMSEAPVGAFIGSAIDVDLFLGPLGSGAAKIIRGGKLVNAVGAAAAGAAVSGTASTLTSETVQRSSEQIFFDSMIGAFSAIGPSINYTKGYTKLKSDVNPTELDKVTPGFSQYLSAHDKLSKYAGKDLANKLLANPVDDIPDSAVTYARDTKLTGDRMLAEYDAVVDKYVGAKFTLNPKALLARRETRRELEGEMQKWMNQARYLEERGLPITEHADPRVRDMANAYINSGYAKEMLARLKASGEEGAALIDDTAYYIPVKHSYEKMRKWVDDGNGTFDNIYKMYGVQIARMFPDLEGYANLTPTQLGKHFVNTQKARVSDAGGQTFRGMTRNEIASFLSAAGVDEAKIGTMLDSMYARSADAGKAANLRRRLDWNFESVHYTGKGNALSVNDFLESDVTSILQRYNRNMAGRVGLANAGFKSEAALDEALQAALDKAPKGVTRAEALEFFDNVKSSLLGRPVGERVPDVLRSATTLGSALHLANSGLYNLVDYAHIATEFGIRKAAAAFIPNIKSVLKNTVIPKKEAENLKAVLTGNLYAEGRFRSVVTHLEDNFDAPLGGAHEAVQYSGQSVRYLNGSEYVRRHQLTMVAGILDDLTVKLANGDAKAAEYFRRLNIPEDKLTQIIEQTQKHGTVLEEWPRDIRTYFTTAMTSATDNVALMIRNGEQPAFMQYSLAGKIIFPYMSFVFGATNKLLRRNHTRDGALGVASMLIMQAPLAVLVAGLINVTKGKPFDQDLESGALKALPGIGIASVPIDAALRGEIGGTATAFATPNAMAELLTKAGSGTLKPSDVVKNTPGLAIVPGAKLAASAFD